MISKAVKEAGLSKENIYPVSVIPIGSSKVEIVLQKCQIHRKTWAFVGLPVAQMINNPPAMQETLVQSLGREDPLEKEMPTHSSIIAWRIPWTEKPTRLSPWDRKQLDTTE